MALETSAPTASASQLGSKRRFGVLAICCMSLLIVGLDNTIVNVALPSIGRELHASVSGLQWTVAAYTLVLASLLMLSGSTADRLGRKRTFQIGLTLFSIGSLACSLAPNLALLVTFRALQAVGGSMLNPVAMSIITNVFTEQRERAQAIGVWAAVMGVSMALGPIVGGALVSSAGWRSIFWINVPIGILAVVLTHRYVPESRAPRPRRFDLVGQLLVIVLLASLTFGIIEGPGSGWFSAKIVGSFALSLAAAVCLVAYEPRRFQPLLDLRFFRSVPFSGATLIAVASFASLAGFLFLNTLYLQESRHLSPLGAGLDTLPMAAATILFSPLSGRIVGRRGTRVPLLVAGLGIAVSGVLLTHLTNTTSFTYLFVAYVIYGIAFGVVNAPITNTAVSGMPRSQAGVAAGVASTSRQIGQSLGVAVVGAIATAGARGDLATHLAVASHPAWWTIAGCGGAIFLLGLLVTSPWALATARRASERFSDEDAPPPEPRA
ncbi:MAG: EmrB/QacA subfamily drug resistance transporter [Acidimicrobiaceae bacterium]|nr:EmrB/QacA subfamily drug resistance transporter [Acidimicrobiaceae bacterium]